MSELFHDTVLLPLRLDLFMSVSHVFRINGPPHTMFTYFFMSKGKWVGIGAP